MTVAQDIHVARTALERAQVCVHVLAKETDPDRAQRLRAEGLARLDAVIAIATAAKAAFR